MSSENAIQGAEAIVTEETFLGHRALMKYRPAKTYRLPELDTHIRSARTKNEAKIMHDARAAGVRTPCIYDIDLSKCSIVMEFIEGKSVKDVLNHCPERADEICEKIGQVIARMHSAGICHGDLTTSNMILENDGICLIDFSMGCTKADLEDIGVDLRLLERAFSSAHVGLEPSFSKLMDTYYSNVSNAKQVRKKLEDIKNRARYT